MSLGENIRYRRTVMGLTQKQLAAKIGIGTTRMSEYERGRHKPQEVTLEWIAGALDCRVEELFTDLAPSRDAGRKIRALRKKKGISQEVLAGFVGVTYGAVAKWECGYTRPLPANLLALADALGCRVEDLI